MPNTKNTRKGLSVISNKETSYLATLKPKQYFLQMRLRANPGEASFEICDGMRGQETCFCGNTLAQKQAYRIFCIFRKTPKRMFERIPLVSFCTSAFLKNAIHTPHPHTKANNDQMHFCKNADTILTKHVKRILRKYNIASRSKHQKVTLLKKAASSLFA